MSIRLKRAYGPAERGDGYRVLVDRLWPRGVSKGNLAVDAWLRELAPSDELRKWVHADPERWDEFRARYRDELRSERAQELIAELARRAAAGTVTLVYAAKDEVHNNAVALKAEVERRAEAKKRKKR